MLKRKTRASGPGWFVFGLGRLGAERIHRGMEIEVNRLGRRLFPSRQFRLPRHSPASTDPLAHPAFST